MQEIEESSVIQLASLSLAGARRVLDAAEDAARQRNLRLCIAVADAAGNLLAFARMDGAPIVAVTVAMQKARTAAQLGCATKALQDMANGDLPSVLAVREIMPVEGGVPVLAGNIKVGGVGASGAASADDAFAAAAGAKALE